MGRQAPARQDPRAVALPACLYDPAERKLFKIVRAHCEDTAVSAPAGTVIAADKGGIRVACGRGVLVIETATPEGKKAQSAADLVNGRQIAVGDKLG